MAELPIEQEKAPRPGEFAETEHDGLTIDKSPNRIF